MAKININARSYEMVFTATVKIIREAENGSRAIAIAKQICPKGFTVKEVNMIKSREHYRGVKKDMADQFEIPILI